MNLQDTIAAVQKLTTREYTEAELRQIHEIVNEARSKIGQPGWTIEDKTKRDELQEMVINSALVEYYRKSTK